MTTTVCFTGKGYTDKNSTQPQLRTRSTWTGMAKSKGWSVVSKVNAFTTYLVASTTTTVKAKEATAAGRSVKVITYDQFQSIFDAAVKDVVTTQGRDLTDPDDDGSIDYDPLEAQQAAYDAAQRAADREDREERAHAKRIRDAAERERQEAEARRIADEEAIPGWGQF